MGQIREIKDRISSIDNTMKITNAMYMISSTKMNNARRSLAATEPYFYALQDMFARVMRHLPEGFHHPYLDNREKRQQEGGLRRAIICVTADKGLAGSYNHNIIKLTEELLADHPNGMLFTVGEVGRQYFLQHHIEVDGEFHYTAQKPTLARARSIAFEMLDLFEEKKIDEVFIVFTSMKNSMETQCNMTQLLPLIRLNAKPFNQEEAMTAMGIQEDFELEPNASELLYNIVPDYLNGYIYSALVEAFCSEHSARMQAMDSANKNGQELLQELNIRYNRERQAQITQEITEVAAGAKARAQQLAAAARRKKLKKGVIPDANR